VLYKITGCYAKSDTSTVQFHPLPLYVVAVWIANAIDQSKGQMA